jgi:CRISPR-associated protein (TIGR02584 family)
MSGGDVYLIAPLGLSPGVLTETLWWLVVQEGRRVVGVELWVTDSDDGGTAALQTLRTAIAEGSWDKLRRAVDAEQLSRLPELSERFRVQAPQARRPISPGLTVFAFARDDRSLSDNRATADAHAVGLQLHGRVRFLREALPETTGLVGSIAGGRKNFGTALQAAFEFHGRPLDRLVHVLLHPDLERREDARQFVVPDPALHLPLAEQITLFDIPYPPLRSLVPGWASLLDRTDPVALWAEFRRNSLDAPNLRATLSPEPKHGWLRILGADDVRFELKLTQTQFDLYAAIVALPHDRFEPGTQKEEWCDHLIERGFYRDRSSKTQPTLRSVEVCLSQTAQLTAQLVPRGLGGFALVQDGCQSHVPWASRIELPPFPPARSKRRPAR